MAELVDALASGASGLTAIEVQVLLRALSERSERNARKASQPLGLREDLKAAVMFLFCIAKRSKGKNHEAGSQNFSVKKNICDQFLLRAYY